MRFQPVVAEADVDLDGAGEFEGTDHAVGDDLFELCLLIGLHVEDEFVVNLQEHAALEASASFIAFWMRTMAILIMSAAVPWMGMLMALRSAAARMVPLPELISLKWRRRPRDGLDVAFFFGAFLLRVHVARDARELREVVIDDFLRFGARRRCRGAGPGRRRRCRKGCRS